MRADVQAGVAMLAPMLGMRQTYDITDEQARAGPLAGRGDGAVVRRPVGPRPAVCRSSRSARSTRARTLAERFLIRWKGEPDPAHVKAIDAYWSSAAEHGMNASTFTARVITSTGADVAAAFSGAIGAMSGPLHGGAPSRVLGMIEEVEKTGDATAYVKQLLDSGERLMGFGHRVYRAEDPRARVLRRTARELGAPRYEVAEALEQAALAELRERRPDRVLETNVEFWAAIVLDFAEVPANMFTSMFTCARTGGWSAHILEQKRTGRLIRPSAVYVGPSARKADEVDGWKSEWSRADRWPIVPDARAGRHAASMTQRSGTIRTGRAVVPAGDAARSGLGERDVHVVAVPERGRALPLRRAARGEVVLALELVPRGVHVVVPDDVHDPHPPGERVGVAVLVGGERSR